MPTEAEFEFAARGGLSGQVYPWGNEFPGPKKKHMANTFQGSFPNDDQGKDGFSGIAPVAQYEPNGYGLYDMAGNVWEWASDWYRPNTYQMYASQGKITKNPKGPPSSYDPQEPQFPKACPQGRLLSLYRSILLTLHGGYPRKGRNFYWDKPLRVSLREGREIGGGIEGSRL